MNEPRVRARHLKATLARVALSPRQAAVLAALPPGYAERVEEAYGGDWLPVDLDVDLARALRRALSTAEHHAFCVGAVRSSFEGPILGTLVHAAVAVLGRDVRRIAAWVPKGWALTFREVGAWTVRPAPDRLLVELTLSGLPPACTADEDWATSVASSLSAICDLAGVEGRVRLARLDAAAARADYLLRWEPPTPTAETP